MTTDSVKFFPLLKVDGKTGPIEGKLDLHTTAFYTPNTKEVLFKFKVKNPRPVFACEQSDCYG